MPDSERSIRILNNITDLLRNHRKDIEPAEGLIFRAATQGQKDMIDTVKILRVKYELPLHFNQSKYRIHNFVGEITNLQVSREALNPEVELPETTPSGVRYIIIHNSDTIEARDWMEIECFIRCRKEDKVDYDTDPIVPEEWDYLLEELVLSGYRTVNKEFRSRDEVMRDIRAKKNDVLGINGVNAYRPDSRIYW